MIRWAPGASFPFAVWSIATTGEFRSATAAPLRVARSRTYSLYRRSVPL